jgi:hypothetical protein
MDNPSGTATEQLTLSYDVSLPYPLRDGILAPALQVGLQFGDSPIQVLTAYVDSGADMSVIAGREAVALGVDPTVAAAQVVPILGIAGQSGLYAYVHRVLLHVGTPLQFSTMTAEVAFTHPDIPLRNSVLGRRGFLDRVSFGLREGALPPRMYLGFRP